MSIFTTKILLATDDFKEAALAAQTAAEMAQKTGSELHVVHARQIPALSSYYTAEVLMSSEVDDEALRHLFSEYLTKGLLGNLERSK